MWSVIAIFSIIWILGWLAAIKETSVSQDKGWKKVKGIVSLFFIWWWIAIAMANQGDI